MQPRVVELSSLFAHLGVHIPPEKREPNEPVREIEPKEKASMDVSGEGKRGVTTKYEEPIIFNERQRRYIHSLLQRWKITNYEELELLTYIDPERKKIAIEIRTKKDKRLIKKFFLDDVKDIDYQGIIIDRKV